LRILNPAADWAESSSLALPARLPMAAACAMARRWPRCWTTAVWCWPAPRGTPVREYAGALCRQRERQTQARAALRGRQRP
jgi:hypothetical protein